MALSGSFQTMDISDLLQWLGLRAKTGVLSVSRKGISKSILLREGKVVSSSSNSAKDHLGQTLINMGRIDEEHLQAAFKAQSSSKASVLLGKILVIGKLVSEDDVKEALGTKIKETLLEVFHWDYGDFNFQEESFPVPKQVEIAIPVEVVIKAGRLRCKEWEKIKEVFPSPSIQFKVLHENLPQNPSFGWIEERVLEMVKQGRGIEDITLETRCSSFRIYSILYDFYQSNYLEVEKVEETPGKEVSQGDIPELLEQGRKAAEAGSYEEAEKIYQEILDRDGLHEKAQKELKAVNEKYLQNLQASISQERIPYVKVPFESLQEMPLDPNEAFLISRINGLWDVRSIVMISPIPLLDALKVFKKFLDQGIIGFKEAQ